MDHAPDTPIEQHEAKTRQRRAEIYSRMTPSEKWAQAVALREVAWKFKAASVRSRYPDWTEEQVHDFVKKVFLYAVT